MNKKQILVPESTEESNVPRIKSVHPFGSKILIEVLKADEVLGTNLYINDSTKIDGAPQAYVIELGPQVSLESGVKVGQRIYWEGKGCPVDDPRTKNGRTRALLEIANIRAIIED